ncbi:MAG: hypothetical protein PHR06_14760, partial [Candidatus Cloacimonetes bacterium]|nr:hypothetical protein [Candidatus Cloacimonadota bacterium]
NVTSSGDILSREMDEIIDTITSETGMDKQIYQGFNIDENMGNRVSVTVIATGLESTLDKELALNPDIHRKKDEENKEQKELELAKARIGLHDDLKSPAHKPQEEPKSKIFDYSDTPIFIKQYTN